MARESGPANGDLAYRVNEQPRSTRDYVLYSFQWLVTMFYGVVWGYAIVGVGLGFEGETLTRYMAAVVLTIGVATLLQAWRGHGFAMVSGPNVIPSLAIVAALAAGGREYAMQSFTAQAIAGVLLGVLAFFGILNLVRRIWSPLILGAMVLMVGLAIAGQGLGLLVEAGFGWPFWVGAALALSGSVLAIRGKGVWATLPVLLIIGLGYLIFIVAGDFDWARVTEAPLFVLPAIFPYGFGWPPLDLIVIMFVVNLMAALNMYGNVTGYAEVVKENFDAKKTRRSFTIFSVAETALPGILGTPATVPYGENLGIIMLTKVAARAFIIVAAIGFIVLAFFGPMGGLMAAMPSPVAGAVLLGIASTAVGIGIDIMTQAPAFGRREQTLVGFSVFLSLGLFLLPDAAWDAAPRLASTIFTNPIVTVILFVLLFEQVIFRGTASETAGHDEIEESNPGEASDGDADGGRSRPRTGQPRGRRA